MSKNGNKIKKGEKRRRREARERRLPRNYIRCELLPETPFSVEWPPPRPSYTETLSKVKLPFGKKMKTPRQWPQLQGRLLPGNAAPSPRVLAGDTDPAGPAWLPSRTARGRTGADRRQSQVQGGGRHAALARAPASDLFPPPPPTPSLWGAAGPWGSLQTRSWGLCCRALNRASRFPVWGTSWRFCILEKK